MNMLSAHKNSLFIILMVALVASKALGQGRAWPVKGDIDLSSGFCEFRPLHFHGGIDIRTGGTTGRKVYSPVDGYIWKIKYSYTGYGKGLYIRDSQGYFYVFGHLSALSERLEKVVKSHQYRAERYYVDEVFEPDSIPVKEGELIAYSGQTGSGGPHLHFEIRNPSNMPLNPLTNGFPVADQTPPVFKEVAFIYQDSCSIFSDGGRRKLYNVIYDRGGGRFLLDSVAFVQASFGIAINAYDLIRPHGRRLNIYSVGLFIDDYLFYENKLESYDYSRTAMVDLTYDYQTAVDDNESWYLLFDPPGKISDGSRSMYKERGIFTGRTEYSYGLHKGRIEISDAAGNQSELAFEFILAPGGNLFELEALNDSTLYLHGQPDNKFLDISDIAAYGVDAGNNRRPLGLEAIKIGAFCDYRLSLSADRSRLKGIRIDVHGESGWNLIDQYYSLSHSPESDYNLEYALKDGGLLLTVKSRQIVPPAPRVDIIYEDGYRNSILAKAVSPRDFAAFYENDRISTKIVGLEVYDGNSLAPDDKKEVSISLVGGDRAQRLVTPDERFTATFEKGDSYYPFFVEVAQAKMSYPNAGDIVGGVYSLQPKTVPLAADIGISIVLNEKTNKSKVGLCRLGDNNKWSWVDSRIDQNRIYASIRMMGTYAPLEDTQSPRVKKISPLKGSTVKTALPEISCLVGDDLSGIADDRNIRILLDGRWLIPEYDPETEQLTTYPAAPLSDGLHQLTIEVSDRAGNSRTVESQFYVKGE
jgi:hypothetical protein